MKKHNRGLSPDKRTVISTLQKPVPKPDNNYSLGTLHEDFSRLGIPLSIIGESEKAPKTQAQIDEAAVKVKKYSAAQKAAERKRYQKRKGKIKAWYKKNRGKILARRKKLKKMGSPKKGIKRIVSDLLRYANLSESTGSRTMLVDRRSIAKKVCTKIDHIVDLIESKLSEYELTEYGTRRIKRVNSEIEKNLIAAEASLRDRDLNYAKKCIGESIKQLTILLALYESISEGDMADVEDDEVTSPDSDEPEEEEGDEEEGEDEEPEDECDDEGEESEPSEEEGEDEEPEEEGEDEGGEDEEPEEEDDEEDEEPEDEEDDDEEDLDGDGIPDVDEPHGKLDSEEPEDEDEDEDEEDEEDEEPDGE
jgi:hypothetical protein